MEYTKTYNENEVVNITITEYTDEDLSKLPDAHICNKQKCICISCDYSCMQCKDCGINGYVSKCSSYKIGY